MIPKYTDPIVPPDYSEKTLYDQIIPKIAGIHDNKPYSAIRSNVYEQKDLQIGMTLLNNVWSMCTHNILMIDFDFKTGMSKETALNMLRKIGRAHV